MNIWEAVFFVNNSCNLLLAVSCTQDIMHELSTKTCAFPAMSVYVMDPLLYIDMYTLLYKVLLLHLSWSTCIPPCLHAPRARMHTVLLHVYALLLYKNKGGECPTKVRGLRLQG